MKISRAKAVEHKCHQCMGGYLDGRVDCEVVTCPLYTFMPYRKLEPVTDWSERSPRAVGWRTPRTIPEDRKEKLTANLARARAANRK